MMSAESSRDPKTRLVFAIEDNVGNATYRQNLSRVIEQVPDVEATFLPVALVADDIWQLTPVVRNNLALVASARAASGLHAAARRQGAGAALVHSQSIALFSLGFMRRVPTIISTDATPANFDRLPGYPQPARGAATERLKALWTRASLRVAARLLAWSDWVKESFVDDYGVPPEKIDVIPAGLDTGLWKPDASQRASDGKVRVFFASGDFTRKGGDILLRWMRASPHRRDVELHMAVKERALPDAPGVFKHYGLTANSQGLVALAQRCDLFALPTRADCSPWAVLEAQAAGLPGVSTRVGAIHDMLVHGETGLLADVTLRGAPGSRVAEVDEAQVFAALDRLVEDEALRARMGAAARARVLARYDARVNTLRLLDVMRKLAG
ncbi:MAG: glycosyltransferase family 4 protein [Polyangiales bacterium]